MFHYMGYFAPNLETYVPFYLTHRLTRAIITNAPVGQLLSPKWDSYPLKGSFDKANYKEVAKWFLEYGSIQLQCISVL